MMYLNMEYAKDEETQLLCLRHISNVMVSMLEVEKCFFEGSDCDTFEEYLVERIFPPNTTVNKNIVKFFEKTLKMLQSDEIYEMNILHEYIIFAAISNYYDGANTEYTLEVLEEEGLNIHRIPNRDKIIEKVREFAIEVAKEVFDGEQSMEDEIQDILTNIMQTVEDISYYTENLEDVDFEFLDECSFDELVEKDKLFGLGIRF